MSERSSTHRTHRIRLPEFMWQALDVLTRYTNETAMSDRDEPLDVSAMIEALVLFSIRVQTLQALAERWPEFQRAISEWVAMQIEREPEAAAIFSTALWNFAKRTN
jgi:hypothetical protein